MDEANEERVLAWLDSMPTRSRLSIWSNERSFGACVNFVETGFGFGEITLAVDMETGEASCDLEAMTPKRCAELWLRAVGTPVRGLDERGDPLPEEHPLDYAASVLEQSNDLDQNEMVARCVEYLRRKAKG